MGQNLGGSYLEGNLVGQDGGVSMRDVGEGSGVDEDRGPLKSLHLEKEV